MSELATPTSVREHLSSLAAPLREQLEEVDEAVAAKLKELNELRESQRTLRAALRHIDPTFAEVEKAASKNGGKSKRQRAKPALDRFLGYLREHAEELNEGEGFTAPWLVRRDDFAISRSAATKMLADLHEQGIVRLVRTGGSGGAKWWKVVV